MTDIRNKLERAGINTAGARLSRIAQEALDRAKGNAAKALQAFHITVLTDAELLRELMGKDEVWKKAAAFLDEKRQSWVPSQTSHESPEPYDRHPNPVSPTSLKAPASQSADDRRESTRAGASEPLRTTLPTTPPAPSQRDRTSQERYDVQDGYDRPVAPSTRILKSAARSVASVFDERVSAHFEKTYGDITQYDYLNLRITLAGGEVLRERLAGVKWPDMHTPLRKFADPVAIAEIRDARNAAVDRELAAVKGITHATH